MVDYFYGTGRVNNSHLSKSAPKPTSNQLIFDTRAKSTYPRFKTLFCFGLEQKKKSSSLIQQKNQRGKKIL